MLNFLQQTQDLTTQTVFTFLAQNLGTVDAERYIIISIAARKAGTAGVINSVTIGGVTATIIDQGTSIVGGNNSTSGLYIVKVPAGATGDVVVTMSTAFLRCSIALWRATGLLSPTPVDTAKVTTEISALTIDVPKGGFIIGGAMMAVAAASATWVNLSENFDVQFQSVTAHSGASATFPAAVTDQSISCSWSAGNARVTILASFAQSPIKKVAGVARPSIKKIAGVAIASVKKIGGVSN